MSNPTLRGPAFLCAAGLSLAAALSSPRAFLHSSELPDSVLPPVLGFSQSDGGAAAGAEKSPDPWLPPRLSPLSRPAPELPEALDALGTGINPPTTLAGIGPVWDESTFALQRNHKASRESAGFWGSLSSSTEVNDTRARTWDDPGWKRTWKTDESWKYSLGHLSVFGQLGATGDEINQQSTQVTGRTGLACKVPMGLLGEYTVRSGPGISCTDPLSPLQMRERTDWLVEVQARWPLLFGVGLELQSSALPPLSPLDQNIINHDVRLAFPMVGGGQLKVGAKRQQTGLADPRSWTDTTQLYMGLELNH